MELGTCYTGVYLQASFNGIAFECLEASSEHGRRGAEGEFPFGNQTGFVDMGRKIRRYNLTARLSNNDHLLRATALIAACELPGPGVLVHPTRGVLNASCSRIQVRDKPIEEQGVTYLDLEFVEGNLWNNGFGLVGALLGLALRPLLEASSAQFRSRYNIPQDPVYRREEVRGIARGSASQYATAYDRTPSPDPRASAELHRVAQDNSLVDSTELMDELIRKGSATLNSNERVDLRYGVFRGLSNWAAVQTPTTPSGDALVSHMRVVNMGYMAQSSLQQNYASSDEAITAMDQVLAVLIQESAISYDACDNTLFLTLREFQDEYTRQMYGVAYGRPARIEFDFGGMVSPVQAAYAIWDDATRSREIAQGNPVRSYGLVGPTVVATRGGRNG